MLKFDEGYATGSSMLPQKQNPDVAELTRGKAGLITGIATGWQVTLKSVPMAYGLDLQEDKRAVFGAEDNLLGMLHVLTGVIATIEFDRNRMRELAGRGHPAALEIADYLSELGVPFRDAHAVVGGLVRLAESKGVSLEELEDIEFSKVDSRLPGNVRSRLGLREIVDRRVSPGGTAPILVAQEAVRARQRIAWQRDHVRELIEQRLPNALRPTVSG